VLERLVAPQSEAGFRDEHFGRTPLLAQHDGDTQDLAALLSPDAVMAAVDGLAAPHVRVLRMGAELPVTGPDGRVSGDLVAAAHRDGASIALQGVHGLVDELAAVCAGLTAQLGEPVQANAYLTPPGGQALAAHADIHDVFMVQTAGRKQWEIFAPRVELPGARQEPDLREDPGELRLTPELTPGDVLYLPRGWGHRAAPAQERSLHVTIAVQPYTWGAAIRDATARGEDEAVALRRGAAADGDDASAALGSLADRLGAADLEAMRLRAIARSQWRRRDPAAAAALAETVGAETRVRLREDIVVAVIDEGDRVSLLHEQRRTRLPARLAADVLELLPRTDPWCGADLPGDRTAAVRALVAAGILDVV
jgi:hypothetical protein